MVNKQYTFISQTLYIIQYGNCATGRMDKIQ